MKGLIFFLKKMPLPPRKQLLLFLHDVTKHYIYDYTTYKLTFFFVALSVVVADLAARLMDNHFTHFTVSNTSKCGQSLGRNARQKAAY